MRQKAYPVRHRKKGLTRPVRRRPLPPRPSLRHARWWPCVALPPPERRRTGCPPGAGVGVPASAAPTGRGSATAIRVPMAAGASAASVLATAPTAPSPHTPVAARPLPEERGPRLGDTAFRAQRDAMEQAQLALKKLAALAHGEALTQLLTAWQQRDAAQVPGTQELGVPAAMRSAWTQALSAPPRGDASEALLRLEIAAQTPTPAEHIDARRMLQLQLLTRRNDPGPAQTWGQDTALVLASANDAASTHRLQRALKALLRK